MTTDVTVEAGRPWRGMSPLERREARRRRLLAAGLELFGTVGYGGTSLTALCALGGVSPRHFYEIHPGREQLLEELYGEISAEQACAVAAAQARAPLTVHDQVRSGVSAAVGALTEDPRRARVVLLEIVGVGPGLRRERTQQLARVLTTSHDRLVAAGVLAAREFQPLAVALVGALHELLVDWLLTAPRPEDADVRAAAEQVFTIFYEGRPG